MLASILCKKKFSQLHNEFGIAIFWRLLYSRSVVPRSGHNLYTLSINVFYIFMQNIPLCTYSILTVFLFILISAAEECTGTQPVPGSRRHGRRRRRISPKRRSSGAAPFPAPTAAGSRGGTAALGRRTSGRRRRTIGGICGDKLGWWGRDRSTAPWLQVATTLLSVLSVLVLNMTLASCNVVGLNGTLVEAEMFTFTI